jgi:hypothetical protein
MVPVHVVLNYLHGFQRFEPGFLQDLIFSLIGVVFKVTHISDISDIPHFILQVEQEAVEHIKSNGLAGMSKVSIPIYGGSTGIKTNERRVKRFEVLFLSGQGIVN